MNSEGTNWKAVAATPLRNAGGNRLALLSLVVPLLLVLGTGVSTLARRAWSERGRAPYNVGSEAAAVRNARDLCSRLTGGPVEVVTVSQQNGYSLEKQARYREWAVVCDTDWGRYSLRVNDRTSRVYAINALEDADEAPRRTAMPDRARLVHAGSPLPVPKLSVEEPGFTQSWWKNVGATRPIAQSTLNRYFATLGLSPGHLTGQLMYADPSADVLNPEDVIWTFTYRAPDTAGVGLIKISVSASNRRLVNYWNPNDGR